MTSARQTLCLALCGTLISLLFLGCDNAPKLGGAGGDLRIATPSLSAATVGLSYHYDLVVVGGAAPYEWRVSAGLLPPGIDLDGGSGQWANLSGSPTSTGDFDFTISVRDGAGKTGSRDYSLRCVARPLAIAPTTLVEGEISQPYADVLLAQGGVPPYNFSLDAGVLPLGITLAPGGEIAGTPSVAAQASFTVRVTDVEGATATRPFSITVYNAVQLHLPMMSAMHTGVAYIYALSATGGNGNYTFTTQGVVPAGLTLNPNGMLQLASTMAAASHSVDLYVSDSRGSHDAKTLNFNIVALLHLVTTSLPIVTPGQQYSAQITAADGDPGYDWSITAGTLPQGLTLDPTGTPSTVISGLTSEEGSFTFTVMVEDSAGAQVSRNFTLHVAGPLSITTTSLPSTLVGEPYYAMITTSGGSRTGQNWTVQSGQLPHGIGLHSYSSFAVLDGSALFTGTAYFTLLVNDSLGFSATAVLSIDVPMPPLEILEPGDYPYYELPMAIVGVSYSTTISARGGSSRGYAWTIDSTYGPFPFGLGLNSGTPDATIDGTPSSTIPSAIGRWYFRLRVTDSANNVAERVVCLQVQAVLGGQFIDFSSMGLPNGTVGCSYEAVLDGYAGSWTGFVFTAEPALPPGLNITSGTPRGWIRGYPSQAGTFNFNLRITSSNSATAVRPFTVVISDPGTAPLRISAVPRPWGAVFPGGELMPWTMVSRTPTHLLLMCEGGTGQGYVWEIVSGALPAGLRLESDGTSVARLIGEIELTAASARYNFRIRIRDSAGTAFEFPGYLDLGLLASQP